jgi:hypothetical protein
MDLNEDWENGGSAMSIEYIPLSDTVIQQMYDLACTPSNREAFRQKWQDFGWPYKPGETDFFGLEGKITDGLRLTVVIEKDQVEWAYLPFFQWLDYHRNFADSEETYLAETRRYEEVYEQAFRQAEQILGPAFRSGEDTDDNLEIGYRWAVWVGGTELLILHQNIFDGLESYFWLEPCQVSDFDPTPTFLDWFENLH